MTLNSDQSRPPGGKFQPITGPHGENSDQSQASVGEIRTNHRPSCGKCLPITSLRGKFRSIIGFGGGLGKIPRSTPGVNMIFARSPLKSVPPSLSSFIWTQILKKFIKKYEANMKRIWRNFSKSQSLGGSLEFFQVPGIWRNMKKYEENMKEYEGDTKHSVR